MDEGALETRDTRVATAHTAAAKQKLRKLSVTFIHRQSIRAVVFAAAQNGSCDNHIPAGVDVSHENACRRKNRGTSLGGQAYRVGQLIASSHATFALLIPAPIRSSSMATLTASSDNHGRDWRRGSRDSIQSLGGGGLAVVYNAVAFGRLEISGVWLGGVKVGDGEDLVAYLGEILVQKDALSILERTGLVTRRVVVLQSHDRQAELADLLTHKAVVELLVYGVVDLDGGHLGRNVAALGCEQPAFLINAAGAVAHDGSIVGFREGAAIGKRLDPLGMQSEGERRVGKIWDIDTFEDAAATAIRRRVAAVPLGLRRSDAEKAKTCREKR